MDSRGLVIRFLAPFVRYPKSGIVGLPAQQYYVTVHQFSRKFDVLCFYRRLDIASIPMSFTKAFVRTESLLFSFARVELNCASAETYLSKIKSLINIFAILH